MTRRQGLKWLSWSVPLWLVSGFALGAAPPSGSASSAPSASASAAAPASLPSILGADIDSEPSSPPKAAEWKSAREVRVNRGNPGPCRASLVREWLRLTCPTWLGGGLVAGDPKGVVITALGHPFAFDEVTGQSHNRAVTSVVLPLRRGEAKIVTFLQVALEYSSTAFAEAGMLSVVWRTGQADPILVMTVRPEPSMF